MGNGVTWVGCAVALSALTLSCGGRVIAEEGDYDPFGIGGSGGEDFGSGASAGFPASGGSSTTSGGVSGGGSTGRAGGSTGGRSGGSNGGGTSGGGTAGSGAIGGSTGGGGTFMPCPAPQARCGDVCVNLATDESNCGSCNGRCVPGDTCMGGVCTPPATECRSFETYCPAFAPLSNGGCIDLSSNVFACGSCNTPCSGSEACVNGQCVCRSGSTYCEGDPRLGAGSYCVDDFSSDWAHCGSCGNTCGPDEQCNDGVCSPPDCARDYCYGSDACSYAYCEGMGCVDVGYDVGHCGGCDRSCTGSSSLFWWDAYECNSGSCACSPAATPCGPGCSTRFAYCPPAGFTGSAYDLCTTLARNTSDRCACDTCLPEVEACAESADCINAMDCTLSSTCIGCSEPYYSCGDQWGDTDPLADALVACMNRGCVMR